MDSIAPPNMSAAQKQLEAPVNYRNMRLADYDFGLGEVHAEDSGGLAGLVGQMSSLDLRPAQVDQSDLFASNVYLHKKSSTPLMNVK